MHCAAQAPRSPIHTASALPTFHRTTQFCCMTAHSNTAATENKAAAPRLRSNHHGAAVAVTRSCVSLLARPFVTDQA